MRELRHFSPVLLTFSHDLCNPAIARWLRLLMTPKIRFAHAQTQNIASLCLLASVQAIVQAG